MHVNLIFSIYVVGLEPKGICDSCFQVNKCSVVFVHAKSERVEAGT